MHPAFALLDQAIEMGHRELAHLAAGEVDKAEEIAYGRDGVVHQALADENLAGPAAECLDSLVAKLEELKGLQARIIDEAQRLQQGIGADLRRLDQEHKRHKGYGQRARPRRLTSMFINGRG